MTNPADQHIATLIELLVKKATKFTVTAADQQKAIDQIAQLRASMEPTIITKKD